MPDSELQLALHLLTENLIRILRTLKYFEIQDGEDHIKLGLTESGLDAEVHLTKPTLEWLREQILVASLPCPPVESTENAE